MFGSSGGSTLGAGAFVNGIVHFKRTRALGKGASLPPLCYVTEVQSPLITMNSSSPPHSFCQKSQHLTLWGDQPLPTALSRTRQTLSHFPEALGAASQPSPQNLDPSLSGLDIPGSSCVSFPSPCPLTFRASTAPSTSQALGYHYPELTVALSTASRWVLTSREFMFFFFLAAAGSWTASLVLVPCLS